MLAQLRIYAPTVILGVLIFYFGFHALTGERGLLSHRHRQVTLALRQDTLANLKSQREELQVRVHLLNNRNLSADLLEERARSLLGYVAPGDYVIRLPVAAG